MNTPGAGTMAKPENGEPAYMEGKKYTLQCCAIFVMKNNKIVKETNYFDQVAYLKQVGFFDQTLNYIMPTFWIYLSFLGVRLPFNRPDLVFIIGRRAGRLLTCLGLHRPPFTFFQVIITVLIVTESSLLVICSSLGPFIAVFSINFILKILDCGPLALC